MIHVSNLLSTLVLITLVIECRSSPKVPGIGEKQKKSGFIDGDFIIGALFPIHEQPLLNGGTDSLKCGNIRERHGIQRVEAAFFAIESINNDTNILPGIKLGINIKDECSSESVALHQTIKLIDEPVPMTEEQKKLKGICSVEEDDISPIIGIIGPGTSSTTIIVQNLLKLFQMPQIGFSATSPSLTNRFLYNYLLRVVPNDAYQVYLMLKLINKFDWNYISVAYSAGDYGQNAAKLIQENAVDFNICIAQTVEIPSSNSNELEYKFALEKLLVEEKARVVLCFCDGRTIKNIFTAIQKRNLTGKFLIFGSDSWSTKYTGVVDDYEEQAVGSLTLSIKTNPDPEFDEYYFKKNLTNNAQNPWFEEFWEYRFNCTFNSTSNTNLTPCTGKEDLKEDHEQDSKILYVIKSIYAMAHGLEKMHTDVCKNVTFCDEFYPFNSSKYMEYLNRTNFMYKNEPVNFTESGGPWRISYNIYNFQKFENGSYDYVKIGEFNGNYEILRDSVEDSDYYEGLELYEDETIQYPGGESKRIKSVCSEPCPAGHIQLSRSGGQQCCWNCIKCPVGEIQLDETTCGNCTSGYWPNENQTECKKVPLIYTHWLDIQSVVSLIIALVGIILTIITATIFVKYRETPVVKSSTRELCYMMLIGMITAHCISFAVIAKPTLISCTIVRTIPAISFTTIYAALLVKTNRIARILAISKKKFPNLNPRFMSLKAQITITSILIAIETVICLVMLVKEPSSPKKEDYVYENKLFIYLICPISGPAMLIPFSFVALLIIMCTLYAVKTRNLPDNFNEAKFIGFSMYVTCITWIAFGLVYYGSDLQVITTCICASTNALVILIFLFFPKLYIILCVPEKNTRANFTTTKGIRCIIGREDSSQSTNKGNLVETNFKYIPDFNSQRKKSLTEQSDISQQRRKSSVVS